jgi:hypothetical protein
MAVADTAKEVRELTVMTLLLDFVVGRVTSVARVQWQLERCQDAGRR